MVKAEWQKGEEDDKYAFKYKKFQEIYSQFTHYENNVHKSLLNTGSQLLDISEEATDGLQQRMKFVKEVNRQLSIFEGFKKELFELKRNKLGFIDFNMTLKNKLIMDSICGGKEDKSLGMIVELKNSVKEHKTRLEMSLKQMFNDCNKEI